MVYKILRNKILRGETEGIDERVNVFYAAGVLTTEQYEELMAMLPNEGVIENE